MNRKIKVLVVDDSALVRRILCDAIGREDDMEVAGAAPDPFAARDKILELAPDVLTLDIEMPRMDGLTFLTRLMHYRPMPVIVISSIGRSHIAMEALRKGAVDVLAKPSGPHSVGEIAETLPEKIRAAFASKVRKLPFVEAVPAAPAPAPQSFPAGSLIAIGASTGGTHAIEEVLMHMPENCPPILIAQHIPPVFSASFAQRLNSLCRIEVREARDGDSVAPGVALIAPGNFHMLLARPGAKHVTVKDGPKVHYQRPAVDVLFRSIAEARLPHVTAALLTGMGADGAEGLLQLRHTGAHTIAQDEATCVVFGMPRAAIETGAAEQVLPLGEIAGAMLATLAEHRLKPMPLAPASPQEKEPQHR